MRASSSKNVQAPLSSARQEIHSLFPVPRRHIPGYIPEPVSHRSAFSAWCILDMWLKVAGENGSAHRPLGDGREGRGWWTQRVKKLAVCTNTLHSFQFLFREFKCILSQWVMSPGGNAQLGDVFKDYFLDHLSLSIWGTIVQSEKINSKLSPSKQDGKITFPILSLFFFILLFF